MAATIYALSSGAKSRAESTLSHQDDLDQEESKLAIYRPTIEDDIGVVSIAGSIAPSSPEIRQKKKIELTTETDQEEIEQIKKDKDENSS